MNLTREEIIERLHEMAEIITRVNVYKNNLFSFMNTDLNTRIPKHHYDLLVLDLYRFLVIDLNKLVFKSKNEKLNIFKLIEIIKLKPFSIDINIDWEEKFKELIEKLKTLRDKKFAHDDRVDKDENVKVGELMTLIMELNITFTEICKNFDIQVDFNSLPDDFNFLPYFMNNNNHSS